MPGALPAISGQQLIRLLKLDGWEERRRVTHGVGLQKRFADRTWFTVVPDRSDPLPAGTRAAILAPKQTGLGSATACAS